MRYVNGIYLASTAILTGDVTCGPNVNLWYGAVVRGDVAPITLMENVNIQDCAVVHCDYGVPNVLEAGVVVGHSAVVHGCRVGADSLIGIGAKLLSGSVVGAECIVAAGSVVPPGMVVPPRSLVMGVPGKVVRAVRDDEVAATRDNNARYRANARKYAEGGIAWPYGKPD